MATPMAKAKAKGRFLKSLMLPLLTELPNNMNSLMTRRNRKIGPISAAKKNEVLLLSDHHGHGHGLDRWDDEYLQARRAILSSYHLCGGRSLKQRMKKAVKGLCGDVGAAVQSRVGVRVYRFTVGCPWSSGVLVFRCFLPHIKCMEKYSASP